MFAIIGYIMNDNSGEQRISPLPVETIGDISKFEEEMSHKHGKRKSPIYAIYRDAYPKNHHLREYHTPSRENALRVLTL